MQMRVQLQSIRCARKTAQRAKWHCWSSVTLSRRQSPVLIAAGRNSGTDSATHTETTGSATSDCIRRRRRHYVKFTSSSLPPTIRRVPSYFSHVTSIRTSSSYRVRHKNVAPGVFGSSPSNGLKFKCEILHVYVHNIYVHTGVNVKIISIATLPRCDFSALENSTKHMHVNPSVLSELRLSVYF